LTTSRELEGENLFTAVPLFRKLAF